MEKRRCGWARGELDIAYHDREWGVPIHRDRLLFDAKLSAAELAESAAPVRAVAQAVHAEGLVHVARSPMRGVIAQATPWVTPRAVLDAIE